MSDDEQRSAREDLATIRRLMQDSRRAVDAGGPHFVLWGLLIAAAFVADWAQATGRLALHPLWIWGVATGLGWIGSTVVGIRTERRATVRTPAGLILMGIWVGTGVALTAAGFLGTSSGALGGRAMLGLTATLLGSALFASSFVLRRGPFRLLAAAWWIAAVPMFLWRDPAAQLVMAGMMAGLMLVPGLWLTLGGGAAGPGAARNAGRSAA